MLELITIRTKKIQKNYDIMLIFLDEIAKEKKKQNPSILDVWLLRRIIIFR